MQQQLLLMLVFLRGYVMMHSRGALEDGLKVMDAAAQVMQADCARKTWNTHAGSLGLPLLYS